jgi:hypothetical protein
MGHGAALAAREPTLEERVRIESEAMNGRFGPVAKRFGLSAEQAMYLATMLGSMEWGQAAGGVGVPASQRKALWTALNALPHPNFGDLTPYNLLSPGKDRWGVSISEGLKGWKAYGPLIEEVAIAHGLDPAILGAYVWTESNFDTRQLNASGNLCAVGLGSVQAQDYPALGGSMSERIRRLQTDPRLNLTLTAREFKSRWNPKDMFGTVMDVWYPAWRQGRRIPHLGDAFGYMQLFSNRYFLLLDMQGL